MFILWKKNSHGNAATVVNWEKDGVFCVSFYTPSCRPQVAERQLAANSTAWLPRVNKNLWARLNPVCQANKVKQSPLSTETSHRRCVYSPSESQTRRSLEIRSCVSSWEFSGQNQESVGGQREKVEGRQEAAGGSRRQQEAPRGRLIKANCDQSSSGTGQRSHTINNYCLTKCEAADKQLKGSNCRFGIFHPLMYYFRKRRKEFLGPRNSYWFNAEMFCPQMMLIQIVCLSVQQSHLCFSFFVCVCLLLITITRGHMMTQGSPPWMSGPTSGSAGGRGLAW